MIRLRLREMQRAGGRPGVHPTPPRRLPVAFQRVPQRAPVLRGRLHHDLFDLVLDQPLGQPLSILPRLLDLATQAFQLALCVIDRPRRAL